MSMDDRKEWRRDREADGRGGGGPDPRRAGAVLLLVAAAGVGCRGGGAATSGNADAAISARAAAAEQAGPARREGQAPDAGAVPTARLEVLLLPALARTHGTDLRQAFTRRFNEPFLLKEAAAPGRVQREVDSCAQLRGVTADDIDVASDPEWYQVKEVVFQCRVLEKLRQAAEAPVSHVRDLLTVPDPGSVLPAGMAPYFGPDERKQVKAAQRRGKTWRDLDPSLKFERTERNWDRARHVNVESSDHGGYLEWWAAGDVNRDGIDDVVIFRQAGPNGGSAQSPAAFVLTRRSATARVEILATIE